MMHDGGEEPSKTTDVCWVDIQDREGRYMFFILYITSTYPYSESQEKMGN